MFATIKEGEGDSFYMIANLTNTTDLFSIMYPVDTLGATTSSGILLFDQNDEDWSDNTTIVNEFATEEYAAYADMMYRWAQAGYIAPDAASNTDTTETLVMGGNYLGQMNWTTPGIKDEGIIIPPDTENEDSPLHPSACMDRPHIIYNKDTKKYVCWLKIMHKDDTQSETVLTADHILGPYTMARSGIKPLHMSAGDFDLVVDPVDGKGYYYFERVHSEMICADLTDDYTGLTGYYSTHFP